MTGVAGLPRPIGYVLGGGASLGAIQVGMLQALSELDIVPDLVAGTSVGSLNGAALALDPRRVPIDSHVGARITAAQIFPAGCPFRRDRCSTPRLTCSRTPSRRHDRTAELYRMWSSNLPRHPTSPTSTRRSSKPHWLATRSSPSTS